jgi:hypothetical protein
MRARLIKTPNIALFLLVAIITFLSIAFIIKGFFVSNNHNSKMNNTNNIYVPQESRGKYELVQGDRSNINDAGIGALYGFSSPDGAIEFLVSSSQPITAKVNAQGYIIRKLSEVDPLWDPGSCAQKPSIEFGGRFVMISEQDGYNFYDIKTKQYKSFGFGDKLKSIYVDGKEDSVIMYMYIPQDYIGGHGILNMHNNFIIRRTVNLNDFSYIDYKITINNLEFGTNFTPTIYYDGSRHLVLSLSRLKIYGIDFNDTMRYWADLNGSKDIQLTSGDIGGREYIDKFSARPGVSNIDREDTVNGQVYTLTDFTVPMSSTFLLGALNI